MPADYAAIIAMHSETSIVPEYPCSSSRRSTVLHEGFSSRFFMDELSSHLANLKLEYDRVKATPVVGLFRAAATRYEEKFKYAVEVYVALLQLENADNAERQTKLCALVKLLKNGAEKFTTLERISRFARLLEKAYFSLTHSNGVAKDLLVGNDNIPLGEVVPYLPTATTPPPLGYLRAQPIIEELTVVDVEGPTRPGIS